MSKYNVGVGEDFPVGDGPGMSDARSRCEAAWHARREHFRHHRGFRRHRMHGPAAFVVLPAAVASITAAVLYPIVTLGIIGGAGLVAAAYRHGRWDHRDWEENRRRHHNRDDRGYGEARRDEGPQPDAPPSPPKENL